ncbi:MICAL-like protein 1 isoform X1 [Scleropages formosus]|uniref:MICAL like 1 n=1 Tax=Scleropages formosus TaxID=113540 RepID=A0A8C9RNR2_SCLFO|nr:MICAL-like protein 1 isoform X1 [Scleropages formosus]
MGSLKALQDWCRAQCAGYPGVDIANMSSSFRDGLAFCAIIHRHRPDLIDFDSLSKDNVYENNRLAFETAESELGIPALLDPEDMVSMKVPDRLSVITYVSQYYNYFNDKSHANPPCLKRPSGAGLGEPAVKRPPEDRGLESQLGADSPPKRGTLSSTCAACQKHVHLVQRFLVDGKLYHRNCFRCRECSSTLLPGSYKAGSEAGSLVCTHHFAKSTSTNHIGRPDLSRVTGPMVRLGGGPIEMETPPILREREEAPLPEGTSEEESVVPSSTGKSESLENENGKDESRDGEEEEGVEDESKRVNGSQGVAVNANQSRPPNPFEDSEEEEAEEEGTTKPLKDSAGGELPSAPAGHVGDACRPVPAPRRVSDPSTTPRPVPRVRPPRVVDGPKVNGEPADLIRSAPKPRERSSSPGSFRLPCEIQKPKDPPWLALVQSEPKKKPAPPPPPGTAAPPRSGSVPSIGGVQAGSRPATPPQSSNPFENDEEEEEEEEDDDEGEENQAGGSVAPPSSVTSHPWYGIMQTSDTPQAGGPAGKASPSDTPSPGSPRSKKRPAPRAPQPSPQALSSSQPPSSSPSPALSTESLSSSSDHSSSRVLPSARLSDQDHPFTKSVSEPSISGPSPPTAENKPHPSPSPSPPPPPANTSSAPATPQTNRSAGPRAARPPPPRPPTTPSPLAKGTPPPPPQNKRTCKENPFNRKASPSGPLPKARPPAGPRPARPPAPGHGFPLIKRKVQSDQYIPVEDIYVEMGELEKQLDELEQRGVVLEQKLRDCHNDEDEEHLLVEWFTLIHEKHMLVRREAELVYTAKQQNLEERQADVEYELRCLLNKPEREWSEEDHGREQELMAELVTIIEQRNQIINSMDQDRQREEEEDKLLAAVIKKKEFHKEVDGEHKKKGAKFKPMKVLKMLSPKNEGGKNRSPRKDKS